MRQILHVLMIALWVASALADEAADPLKPTNVPWPPVPEDQVARYTALRTVDDITIDGRLDDQTWQQAPRSPRFVDLIRGHRTVHDTQAAVTWDDKNLYIAYWIQDPLVSAHIDKRDDPVYTDNDVEFFLAFDHAYYEFEINPYGTLYEGLFVWQSGYDKHGFSKVPELDRTRDDVTSQAFHGVGYTSHPRGPRYAFLKWDCWDSHIPEVFPLITFSTKSAGTKRD